MDISGWYIEIDDDEKTEIINPKNDGVLEAKSYIVIACDDSLGDFLNEIYEEYGWEFDFPYASVSIPSEGGLLRICDKYGKVRCQVEYPRLALDEVYAVDDELSEMKVTKDATPGSANGHVQAISLDKPVFDVKSGFYEEAFELNISAKEGEDIYYTTDGSIPTVLSNRYEGPILIENNSEKPNVYNSIRNVVPYWKEYEPDERPVKKANVIRAIAVDENKNVSEIETKSYFVGLDEYKDELVISLVADPDELFGDDGIYVTGKEYDKWYIGGENGTAPTPDFYGDTQLLGYCGVFQPDGEYEESEVGIKIQGGSAREEPKKRFNLTAKNSINGKDSFLEGIFEYEVNSVTLRNENVDAMVQEMCASSGTSLIHQDGVKVQVFLDGEFWYEAYVRPRYSKSQIAKWINADKSDVVTSEVIPQEIYDFLGENQDDLSDEAAYKQLERLLDVEEYIDFMAMNIYLCNMDMCENKNLRMYKNDSGSKDADNRWHFMLYDMDAISWNDAAYYGVEHTYEIDTFTQSRRYIDSAYESDRLFAALCKNKKFRQRFSQRFTELADKTFAMDNAEGVLRKYDFEPDAFDSFFEVRRDYIVEYMSEFMERF